MASPPPKRKRQIVLYRPDMTEKYPCLIKSSKSSGHIYCTVCFSDFLVDNGMNDCTRHINGPKHVKNVKSVSCVRPVSSFSITHTKSVETVTNAEVMFTGFLLEHNIPLAAADHVGRLFKSMFLNKSVSAREIIEKYSCGRTKSTHIVKEIASQATSALVEAMKNDAYSIATDASNDRHDKLYPLVIRLAIDGVVENKLLSIIEVEGKNTGVKVAEAILGELKSKGISFENCVAFTSDNANIMIGKKAGCYGELLKTNSHLISTGCICHRLHLAAKWAGKQLPVNIEQFFIDIYYYIEKSSCWVKNFKAFQEECGVPQRELCKHAPTRWLSLSKTCQWVIEQWPALERFFEEECKTTTEQARDLKAEEQKHDRKRKVLDNLQSRTMNTYIHYLSFILPEFDKVNMQLQSEASMVHVQLRLIQRFIHSLMTILLKPCALKFKGATDVDYKSAYNIKSNSDVMIGEETKKSLTKLNKEKLDQFYPSVKKFLQTAITYLLKNGQLQDDYLKNAEVADVNQRETTSWKQVEFFLDKFPAILPNGITKDGLQMQFMEFQSCLLPDNLPDQMELKWKVLGETIKDVTGQLCLDGIAKAMTSILAIPHSNASCERIFSIVRKNRTDFRASMSVKTLESLLILKQTGVVCHERKNAPDLLKLCKTATVRALNS